MRKHKEPFEELWLLWTIEYFKNKGAYNSWETQLLFSLNNGFIFEATNDVYIPFRK